MKSTMIDNKIVIEFDVGKYDKNLIDLLTMIEIANKSKATDEEVDQLADEIKRDWWENNKKRFIHEENNS